MSRTMNVGKRAESLLEKALRHHNIAMRSQLRYAARPDSVTGQLELKRVEKHDTALASALADLKKLVETKF